MCVCLTVWLQLCRQVHAHKDIIIMCFNAMGKRFIFNEVSSKEKMLYSQKLTALFDFVSVNVSCPLPCPEASWKWLLYPKHLQQPLQCSLWGPLSPRIWPRGKQHPPVSTQWFVVRFRELLQRYANCQFTIFTVFLDLSVLSVNGSVSFLLLFIFHGPQTTQKAKINYRKQCQDY